MESSDDPRVVRVPVRAHGPFAFSRKFDEQERYPLLLRSTVLNFAINSLSKLPAWASELNEGLVIRSIFGTAAIEGSPLNEDQVSRVLANAPSGVPAEKEQVILNLREAYRLAGVGVTNPLTLDVVPLTEDRVRLLHKAISDGLTSEPYFPGAYRVNTVSVGDSEHGGVYTPPKVPDDIAMLMTRFVAWINSPELLSSPRNIDRAFLAHYHLALIHPFTNGNGRLARVVEAEMLERTGFGFVSLMMSNYYYENIDEYYRVFRDAEKNSFDLTPFMLFCYRGLLKSYESIHARVVGMVGQMVLRTHYDNLRKRNELTKRRYGLLLLLLDHGKPFQQGDLKTESKFAAWYAGVSERTVKRDLDRLVKMGLLTHKGNSTYELNLKALS